MNPRFFTNFLLRLVLLSFFSIIYLNANRVSFYTLFRSSLIFHFLFFFSPHRKVGNWNFRARPITDSFWDVPGPSEIRFPNSPPRNRKLKFQGSGPSRIHFETSQDLPKYVFQTPYRKVENFNFRARARHGSILGRPRDFFNMFFKYINYRLLKKLLQFKSKGHQTCEACLSHRHPLQIQNISKYSM